MKYMTENNLKRVIKLLMDNGNEFSKAENIAYNCFAFGQAFNKDVLEVANEYISGQRKEFWR